MDGSIDVAPCVVTMKSDFVCHRKL